MDNDNIRLPAHPDDDVVPRRPFPRDLDQAAEPNDRVADFYAQISKRGAQLEHNPEKSEWRFSLDKREAFA